MSSIIWLVLMWSINVSLLIFFRYQGLLVAIILNLYSIRFVPLNGKTFFSSNINNYVEKLRKISNMFLIVPCFFVLMSIFFKSTTKISFLVYLADLSYFKTTTDKILLALNGYSMDYQNILSALEYHSVFKGFYIEIFVFVFSSLMVFAITFPTILVISAFKYRQNVIATEWTVIFSIVWVIISLLSLSVTYTLGLDSRSLLATILSAIIICMISVAASNLVKQSSNFEK